MIRLANGSSNSSGRVEVYIHGEWGTVCDHQWDFADALVVCRQLGYQTAITSLKGAYFGQGTGPIWMYNVWCRGYENSLLECRRAQFGIHNCYHSKDAGVVCGGKKNHCFIVCLITHHFTANNRPKQFIEIQRFQPFKLQQSQE